jgi:hypothetical protein
LPAVVRTGGGPSSGSGDYRRCGARRTGHDSIPVVTGVTIAAGLVGMHHLVAEPSGHAGHSAHTTPMILAASPGSSLMSPTPTEHSHAGPLAVNPVEASVTATAVQASHPCCGDPRDLGRCCFAVSTTISALTTVLIFVAAWRRPWGPGHLLVGVGAVAARAPPTDSVRFTRLCVLMR